MRPQECRLRDANEADATFETGCRQSKHRIFRRFALIKQIPVSRLPMKTLNTSVALLSLGLLVSPWAQAQDQSKESANAPRGEGRRGADGAQGRGQMMNAEARVKQLDEVVSLTADQKTKITAIYTKAQDDMRAMMRDGGGEQQANREKMMESMRATRDQVRAVLTDEQKTKFDAMPQRGRGEGRGRDAAPGGGSENRGKKKA